MTELNQVYKCLVCGNITEVLHTGIGELVCCGQPMSLLIANTEDAATEKHVPVAEETADGLLVKIGSEPHPMTEEHYIEWIEILTEDGQVTRHFLQPGDTPQATFASQNKPFSVREHCNLHGLWVTKG